MQAPIEYSRFADLYDAFVRFEEDIPFFREAVADRRTLELMAGTGRVSLPLMDADVDLTCVDSCGAMLAGLRRKLAERDRPARIVRADVRALPFKAVFEMAILPFHSFAELITESDRAAALSSIHGSLRDGGRFICTLHNPAVRMRTVDGTLRTITRFAHPSGAGAVELRARNELDPESGLVTGVQIFKELDRDGRLRNERRVPVRFALPGRDEFERLARAAGFRVIALYGDYERSEYRADASRYMIWLLQRP